MQKNNVKSFICSFLFSILAVVAVQKVFLHTNQTKKVSEETLNTPTQQKISLFAKGKAKKREMPLLTATADTENQKTPEFVKADLGAPVLMAESEILPDLSVSAPIKDEQKEVKTSVSTDLASAEEITFSVQEQAALDEQQNLEKTGVVYADVSDTFEKDSIEVADASLTEEIPLVEDNIAVHSQINLQNGASASQIAMVEPNALINSIQEPDILAEEKNLAEADIKKSELGEITSLPENTQQIDETAWDTATAASEDSEDIQESETEAYTEDSPWVFAKGNKYAKNQAAVEAYTALPIPQKDSQISDSKQAPQPEESASESLVIESHENTVIEQTFNEPLLKEKENNSKLAYEMIQNILIPIPDSILNDADIVPDLTSSPDGVQEKPRHVSVPKANLDEKEKQSGLFKSISSWFNKNKSADNTSKSSKESGEKEKSGTLKNLKDKVYSALGSVDDYKNLNDTNIMPAELRLSFAPNRAEISGQTLRWIYAFADNARDHNDVYIEVRIDGTSSYALQQKRLNLLSTIFASRGVDYRKIHTIFTSREPNSFIIRNIRFNNDYKGETDQ